MARQRMIQVSDQRPATARLQWLTLSSPELAREVRAGQYLLVRCDAPGDRQRLLRRALFVAAAEPALGQVGLIYAPDEPGLAWLAHAHSGEELDVIGPLGRPLPLAPRTGSLLLVGSGPGLAALLLLAQQAASRGAAVTLLAGATQRDTLPPPFLLPDSIEYESFLGLDAAELRAQLGGAAGQTRLRWADQLFAALPSALLGTLRDAVRAAKIRWEREYASVLLDAPLACGVGACNSCVVELRRGPRLLCLEGPAVDLRDLA